VAERLASDGFTVVINYSGDAAPAEALARKIEGKGRRAMTAKADVSDAQAVRSMFDAAETAFGGVDVLVNNAGKCSCRALPTPTTRPSSANERQSQGHVQRAA
jgi:3-oxoacyl-[acyl-carrier protein] reductase